MKTLKVKTFTFGLDDTETGWQRVEESLKKFDVHTINTICVPAESPTTISGEMYTVNTRITSSAYIMVVIFYYSK